MVSNVHGRPGMVGAILLVSALIFVALAGGIVIHRLETTPAASHEARHVEKDVEQGDHGSPEPDDTQDKDA